MDYGDKLILTSILIFLLFILCLVGKWAYNDHLIAKQATCYGKVLQQGWNEDSNEILALQACGGK